MELRSVLTSNVDFDVPRNDDPFPLSLVDSLYETTMIGLEFDALHGRLGVLLDARASADLAIRANTAILVFDGVRTFSWNGQSEPDGPRAWVVMESRFASRHGEAKLTLDFLRATESLIVTGANCRLLLADVSGLPDLQPDFDEPEEIVGAGVAGWDSDVINVVEVSTTLAK